ncbi:MAG: hypothetical protein JO079_15165 [Frankiaceae bacterium]|nr:hypothetical protein [Frankiaceae bacterium]MBV9368727.1 hypothetical protein [Frankiales bacterium]
MGSAFRRTAIAVGVVVVAACSCGGSHHAVKASGTLELRFVSSSAPGSCNLPALTKADAGQACALDGTTTYTLGPSLGDLTVTSADVVVDAQTNQQVVSVGFDQAGAAALKRLTARSLGQTLAVLLNGKVATAASVQGEIDNGALQLVGANPAVVAQIAAALHASNAAQASDAATSTTVCQDEQPQVVSGLQVEAGVQNSVAKTAAAAARFMAQIGNRRAARMWSRQPSDEPVYLCDYAGPAPTSEAVPTCPPGETPMVDSSGSVRSFLVDRHGHSSEIKVPDTGPPAVCSTA